MSEVPINPQLTLMDFPGGTNQDHQGLVNRAEYQHMRSREDAPLLASGSGTDSPDINDKEREVYFNDPQQEQKFSVRSQVINLGNTIVGAGLMALPKVVQTLGIVTGVTALVLVLLCTLKTLGYMLKESTRMNSTDFTHVVRQRLGVNAARIQDFSIFINNVGLLIIYLRIISDVLVGDAEYKGIITDFISEKSILASPYLSVGVVTFCVLLPLSSLEKMDSLAAASASGLSLALLFSVITIALSCVEISKNGLEGVSFGPNPLYFSGDLVKDVLALVSVFPVIFTSLVCHYNLLHVKQDLPPRHYNKMPKIVRTAGCGCVGLYLLVASFGYILFKDKVQGDVLLNFGCDALEPLVGDKGCIVIAIAVRSMYAIVLSMTFPLIHFALRQTEMSVLFEDRQQRQAPAARWGITLANLVVSYVLALKVPNIWTPLQITGAVAAGIIGFIIPSCLHLVAPAQERTMASMVTAWLLLLMGVLVGVVTLYQLATGNLG